jgi:branched-chain amino acid transport system substrate-binding protein
MSAKLGNRRARWAALTGAMTAAAVSLAACGSGSSSGSDTVTFGAYASASGIIAPTGLDEQRGWELAQADINAAGGVGGRQLKIDFRDDSSDPTQARSIMAKFVADKDVLAVMGPTQTASALASYPLAVQAKLPSISLNSGTAVLAQGPNVYRPFVPDSAVLQTVVPKAVQAFHPTSAAILFTQDDPFSVDGNTAFKKALAAANVQVAADVGYPKGTPDLGPYIQKLKNSGAGIICVAAYVSDAANIVKQTRADGVDVPIVGNISYNQASVAAAVGSAPGTLIVGSQWYAGDTGAKNAAYVEAYQKKYANATPGFFGAMAYNSAFMLKAAVEKSNDFSRAGVAKGLASLTNLDALGTPITFKDRDATTSDPQILTYKDGKLTPFKPGSAS